MRGLAVDWQGVGHADRCAMQPISRFSKGQRPAPIRTPAQSTGPSAERSDVGTGTGLRFGSSPATTGRERHARCSIGNQPLRAARRSGRGHGRLGGRYLPPAARSTAAASGSRQTATSASRLLSRPLWPRAWSGWHGSIETCGPPGRWLTDLCAPRGDAQRASAIASRSGTPRAAPENAAPVGRHARCLPAAIEQDA